MPCPRPRLQTERVDWRESYPVHDGLAAQHLCRISCVGPRVVEPFWVPLSSSKKPVPSILVRHRLRQLGAEAPLSNSGLLLLPARGPTICRARGSAPFLATTIRARRGGLKVSTRALSEPTSPYIYQAEAVKSRRQSARAGGGRAFKDFGIAVHSGCACHPLVHSQLRSPFVAAVLEPLQRVGHRWPITVAGTRWACHRPLDGSTLRSSSSP